MSNLNELELPDTDEGDEIIPDFDSLPPQFGDFADPIQPGVHLFQLPKLGPVYELMVDRENKPRLKAMFKDHVQLKIAGTNDRFRHTVTSTPMNKGEGKPKVANMTYLLAAVRALPKSGSRRDLGDSLDKACAAETKFLGTTTLTGFCDPLKDVYGEDGKQSPGVKGCGRRYSSSPYKPKADKYAQNVAKGDPYGGERFAVPNESIVDEKTGEVRVNPELFALRFLCKCGKNAVRVFSNIEVYRPAE